jgi:tetratricopeptide (TPR) repeat protein
MTVQAELMAAVEAMQAGDAQLALARTEGLAGSHPGVAVVQLVRGRALLELGRFRDAIPVLERATRLDGSSAEARLTLGAALQMGGRLEEALDAHARALELALNNPSVQTRVGNFLLEQGSVEEAELLFQSAAAAGHAEALAGLFAVAERRGDLPLALRWIETHPAELEACPAARLAAARILRRLDRAEEAVELLDAIDLASLTPSTRVQFLHALGDALDDTANPNRAFASWSRGNALRGLRFDADAHGARVATIRDRYTRDTLQCLPKAENADERPLFVVGVPRSGSTLVEQMLSCHPDVCAAGELDDLPHLALGLDRTSAQAVNAAAARYLARIDAVSSTARRVVDKLPHNALFLGEIAQLLPTARVVHCSRDELDTGLSIFGRNFHPAHDYATDLTSIGVFQRQHRQLMEHWRKHLPLQLFELRYEQLVREPEPTLRRLLEFCGLAWDPGLLRFHESGRLANTASRAQVQRPLYSSSIGRARLYRSHLAPLEAALEAG